MREKGGGTTREDQFQMARARVCVCVCIAFALGRLSLFYDAY